MELPASLVDGGGEGGRWGDGVYRILTICALGSYKPMLVGNHLPGTIGAGLHGPCEQSPPAAYRKLFYIPMAVVRGGDDRATVYHVRLT